MATADLERIELRPSLEGRLAEIYGAVQRVEKRGKHPQGWEFATESDISDMLRKELASRELAIIPNLVAHEEREVGQTKNGSPIYRHTVDVDYHLSVAGEQTMIVRWRGQADDSSDKGLNKAMTACRKFFLVNLFQVSTGDDPDAHHVEVNRPAAVPLTIEHLMGHTMKLDRRGHLPLTEAEVRAALNEAGLTRNALATDKAGCLQVVEQAAAAKAGKAALNMPRARLSEEGRRRLFATANEMGMKADDLREFAPTIIGCRISEMFEDQLPELLAAIPEPEPDESPEDGAASGTPSGGVAGASPEGESGATGAADGPAPGTQARWRGDPDDDEPSDALPGQERLA